MPLYGLLSINIKVEVMLSFILELEYKCPHALYFLLLFTASVYPDGMVLYEETPVGSQCILMVWYCIKKSQWPLSVS